MANGELSAPLIPFQTRRATEDEAKDQLLEIEDPGHAGPDPTPQLRQHPAPLLRRHVRLHERIPPEGRRQKVCDIGFWRFEGGSASDVPMPRLTASYSLGE